MHRALALLGTMRQETGAGNIRSGCLPSPFEYDCAVELVSGLGHGHHVLCLLAPCRSANALECPRSRREPSEPGFASVLPLPPQEKMRRHINSCSVRHSPL